MAPSPALPPNLAYKEPLRKWQIVQSFDTADDCEDSLGRFFEQARAKRALNMLEPAYRYHCPRHVIEAGLSEMRELESA